MKSYEIHVTLTEAPAPADGWKLSKIDGDPDLGDGARWYQTTHRATEATARAAVAQAHRLWPDAARYKIEHIIYDERQS